MTKMTAEEFIGYIDVIKAVKELKGDVNTPVLEAPGYQLFADAGSGHGLYCIHPVTSNGVYGTAVAAIHHKRNDFEVEAFFKKAIKLGLIPNDEQ